jgi:death-on-curing protein
VREPEWLDAADVRVFQAFLIAEFGGASGVRDEALLESAVARPRNRFAHEAVDLFVLAATHAHGIAKNHPFVDGNKRCALTAAHVFLGLNGVNLAAPEEEVVVMTDGLAAGDIDLDVFANWLRKHSHGRRTRRSQSKARRKKG